MEATIQDINDVVLDAVGNLQTVWAEIGFTEEVCQRRREKLVEHVKTLMTDMVEGERLFQSNLAKKINENGHKFYQLNKELNANLPEPGDNLSLIEMEKYLRRTVGEMEKEVKARLKELDDLRNQEKDLCECLKEEVSYLEKKVIPSKESIEDLRRIVLTLEQEKLDRKRTFARLKSNLERQLDELEQPPVSSFECSVVTDLEDLFTLSRDNLRRLKALTEEYEKRVEDNKREEMELQEKIRLLSDRLGHDPAERDHLLASISGHRPSALFKMREELEELEKAKRENMWNFITQLRNELEEMWGKCYIGEEEKEDFTPYVSDECTEEILEAHSVEVERLRKYHEENKDLYAALDLWHKLWAKHLQLEEQANNPDRLFGNRGCALLQEAKERKRVKAELPRVEKDVEELAKQYLETKGEPFMVKGLPAPDYLISHWHRYHDLRNQEKRERQSARNKQLLHETKLGSKPRTGSVKRHHTGEGSNKLSKHRRLHDNTNTASDQSTISTPSLAPPHMAGRSILREHNHRQLRSANTISSEKTGTSSQDTSVVSSTLHLRSRLENIHSPAYGMSRTPSSISKYSSPRRPQGLPKTPRTLPRPATRRSPRLNTSRTPRTVMRNITAGSPALSAAFRSPHRTTIRLSTNTTTTTPSRWSKVSFLI